jgi:hypothetical protein
VIATSVSDGKKTIDRRELRIDTVNEQPVTYSRLEIVGTEPVKHDADEQVTVYKNAGELMRGVVMNLFTTMESWFGHAEALSAKAAATSVVLAAIDRGLLNDDGMRANLVASLDKTIRDLEEAFFDAGTGLVRPYPGIAVNTNFSGWTAKNLHSAAHALAQAKVGEVRIAGSLAAAKRLAQRIDQALAAKGIKLEEFAHDGSGNDVIAVEIDGKVVYRVLTDASVTEWVAKRLLPSVVRGRELDLSKAYDTFRFLRAFERVGALQYLTEVARALYRQGDMQSFSPLYAAITRGMILAQEPGMVQGPALLGGVYSTPMALVRFLELQLDMGKDVQVARIDKAGVVHFQPGGEAYAKASVSAAEIKGGGEVKLHIELDASRDPLEYVAMVAVPSTTSIKQTADILSDYRGQLIYGQQGMGSNQMQLIAVPFRGSRKLDLLLEGAFKGSSPGVAVIRHIENPAWVSTIAIPTVTVR